MKQTQEGPWERKFWIAVGALAFGSIALSFGVLVLGATFGDSQRSMAVSGTLLFFGMAMIGAILFGNSLYEMFQGKFNWSFLIAGGAWLAFFGWLFLESLGLLE